jgi:DNA-binding transcriptional ArsR family regulator
VSVETVNQETVRIAGHAMRLRILALMGRSRAVEWSPSELSQELREEDPGATLGAVSYHVRVLRDAGLLRESRTALVRGAVQHFYVLEAEDVTGLWAALNELVGLAQRARRAVKP